MSNLAELETRRANYIEQARQAALAGNVTKARELRGKAEKAVAAIDEMKALADLDSVASPMRPPLPGTMSAGSYDGATLDKNRAAYVVRFGNVDNAVKGILSDLHGDQYEAAYWAQRAAFKTYLRRGERHLSAEEHALLKQIVLTPTAVKSAISQGFDSVAAIKATMVEAIDTLGGFAVPVDFQNRVIERLQAETVMRRRASVDSTSRDTVEIPVSTGGDDQYTSAVRVTWVDEKPAAGTADTNLTFGMETVMIHTVMAETGFSRNMVEDAAFDIENFLVKKFAESATIDEDNRFLIGTGVGSPQGILPGGSNVIGLTRRPSGDADELTWDGLISMTYAIPSRYRQKAVWVGNRFTFEAIAKLKDAISGNYLWTPYQAVGGTDIAPMKLLGYECVEQEAMPSVAAGAFPLIFGDMAGYQIFDRIGMTVERYLDSNTARQNMIMYVMRRRLGGQPTEPWRFAVQQVAAS